MFLENPEIKLRALEPEDLEILYKWENSSHLWMHGNTLTPYSRYALKHYIADAQQADIFESKQLRLMIQLQESGSVIGTIDLYDFDFQNKKVGVGILIEEKYRKQNYALQSLNLAVQYCFCFLHLHQIYAFISVDNKASLSLFRKAGYQVSTILKDWLYTGKKFSDVAVLQLVDNQHE